MLHLLKHLSLVITSIVVMVSCGAPPNENGKPQINPDRNKAKEVTLFTAADAEDVDRVHNVKTRGVGRSLGLTFNDKNDVQFSAAQAIGINPVNSIRDAYHIGRPIVKIHSCDDYIVDELTHSMPYLVPEAATLLSDIGKAFTDTVVARGGKDCKIIVTSVLRTDNTISSLRRRNRNAIEASCHVYGTTFDVSWRRFHHTDSTYIMSTEDLKNILGEVLYKLRADGRCYVKFERKQSCFHITTRR